MYHDRSRGLSHGNGRIDMDTNITCTICKARFRVSETRPEMTASDALRHVVREHRVTREEAEANLTGAPSALMRPSQASRRDS